MGVCYSLIRVSEKDLSVFLRKPDLLESQINNGSLYNTPNSFSLDKSWDGLRYMLNQITEDDSSVLSNAIFSNQVIDEEQDFGYGPALYWTPTQVEEISKELELIPENALSKLIKGSEMVQEGIYPGGWEDAEVIAYLFEDYKKWKSFYRMASEQSQAIIAIMN